MSSPAQIDPVRLHDFLVELSRELLTMNERDLADQVLRAAKHFISPLTSEFYGESKSVLERVLGVANLELTAKQRMLAADYVSRIQQLWFSP